MNLEEIMRYDHESIMAIRTDDCGRVFIVSAVTWMPLTKERLEVLRPILLSALRRTEDQIAWFERAREKKMEIPLKRYSVKLRPEPKRIGFVYLMRNNRNGYVKVGFSKSPKVREATLQAEEPDIEMIWNFKGTFADERKIHRRFEARGQRIRGEWFKLSAADITAIKRKFGGAE